MAFEYKPEEYAQVKRERTQKLDKLCQELVEELGMSEYAIISYIEQRAIEKAREVNPDKQYLNYKFGEAAYTYQIDTYCAPKESIDFAHKTVCPDAEEEWVKVAKNDRYGLNKMIIESLILEHRKDYFENLPDSINVNNLKRDVGKSRSLNQGLRKLHNYQKIEKEIEELKFKDAEKERRIKELEMSLVVHEADLKALQNSVGLSELSPKEKAKMLKMKGHSSSQIGEYLNVHRNTVDRWLKDGAE